MKWIKTTDNLPDFSGEYLIKFDNVIDGVKYPFHVVCRYSAVHKAFNAFDDDKEDALALAMHPDKWMPIPPDEEADDADT